MATATRRRRPRQAARLNATIDAAAAGALQSEFGWFAEAARAPRPRDLRTFAEAEIVLVEGPCRGLQFKVERQPFLGLLFDAISADEYRRIIVTGCVQSGKSLGAFVIPILWHLFEYKESVIAGVANAAMGNEKWQTEIRPVIEASKYAGLLPDRGEGARRGDIKSAVRFRNGTTLKFMSGSGRDHAIASFTARVVIMTEVDKYDTPSATSREADPVSRLYDRTNAYGDRARIYEECTTSIPEGRIWTDYEAGTRGRVVGQCGHCRAYVSPERSDLVLPPDAADVLDAAARAAWECPGCGATITDGERVAMNSAPRLLHAGETIDRRGRIRGERKRTDALSFRWSAFNNAFRPTAQIAADEYTAANAIDTDTAERHVCQANWAIPYQAPDYAVVPITAASVAARGDQAAGLERGICPANTQWITCGVDIGKFVNHWVAIAWGSGHRSQIIQYDVLDNDPDRLGVERGTMRALQEYRDFCMAGWRIDGAADRRVMPAQVWIDSGWYGSQSTVYRFCREANRSDPDPEPAAVRWRPIKGHGQTDPFSRSYRHPSTKTKAVRLIGDQYYTSRVADVVGGLVHVNVDHWKLQFQSMLCAEPDTPGAMGLFSAPAREHTKFSHHVTAEIPERRATPGRPEGFVFRIVSRVNHWLDAGTYATAAGHVCGYRVAESLPAPPENAAGPGRAANSRGGGSAAGGWFSNQTKRKGGRR